MRGAMSRAVVVHEREAMPVPAALSVTEAAAIPEVFLTAFDALFVQGELRMGESVLIHAVGSGVGTAALQLARAAGARPIGTSRTAEKLERCERLGLDARDAIVSGPEGFTDAANNATGGRGVDLVIDTVGGDVLARSLSCLAPRGRIVLVGLLAGARCDLPLRELMSRRARITGTVLRSRPLEEKAQLAQRFVREALPLFDSGRLRPVIDAVLPMDRIAEAHELLESNRTFGKVVLAW